MGLDTRISLHKLDVFCTVVELGSVSRAAERLYVAQPVISAHVKSLEQRVGAKLLQRRDNRMVLTEAGIAVHTWAQDVLSRSREMQREVEGLGDGSRGAVAIASSMTVGSYLLPTLLARFRADRPGAHVTMTTSDPEHAIAAVEAGESDFAVMISDTDHFDQRGLLVEVIAEEPLVLVAAPDDHRVQPSLSVRELGSLPFVTSPVHLSRQRMVDRQLAELGVAAVVVAIELGHAESMKRAVRAGLGLAFLYRSSVVDELDRGDLREIELTDAQLHAPVVLVHREDKRFTPMQQQLVDTVRTGLGATADRCVTEARR